MAGLKGHPTLAVMNTNSVIADKVEAPQPANPALTTEGSQVLTGRPTLLGEPPPGLASRFATAPPGTVPEWAKLPSPRERCPFSGASRSWLLDQERLGRIKIVRVRQPGRMRGACFVYVPSLLALLRGELEKQGSEAVQAGQAGGK
jgi:hypothetical protein